MSLKPPGSLIIGSMVCAVVSTTAWAQSNVLADREYVAVNGRTVKIGALGNLVAFESGAGLEDINVKRSREGYILTYQVGTAAPRTVFNVRDAMSDSISRGSPDFILESFSAPPASQGIPADKRMKAVSVVRTRDGTLRLTQAFEWVAGFGPLRITMMLTAGLSNVTVISMKRETDPDVAQSTKNDAVRTPGGGTFLWIACAPTNDCPPRCWPGDPDCDPTRGLRTVPFFGYPAPSYTSIRPYYDNSEHYSAGLVAAWDLPGYRSNEDNQITLGWMLNVRLDLGKSTVPIQVTIGPQ